MTVVSPMEIQFYGYRRMESNLQDSLALMVLPLPWPLRFRRERHLQGPNLRLSRDRYVDRLLSDLVTGLDPDM
jgi:hypothetical protein